MKKIIIGIILGLTITIVASVNSGDLIKADLINKILDIKTQTEENTYSAQVSIDLNNVQVSLLNVPNWLSCTYFDVGTAICTYNNLNLANQMNCIPKITHDSFNFTWRVLESNSTNTGMVLRFTDSGSSANGLTAKLTCHRVGSDYFPAKSIREIITDIVPNYFD